MIGFDGGGRAISLMAALSAERFSLMAVVEQFHSSILSSLHSSTRGKQAASCFL